MSMKIHVYLISPYDDHCHIIDFTKDVSKKDIKFIFSKISKHIDEYIENLYK